jgi:hypothetical protein
MFVVKDQDHCQIIEFMQICRGCQGTCMMWGMCLVQDSFYMLWKKKNWCFSCVTIVRNWLLHLGSSTQLLVVLSEKKESAGFLRLPHLQEVHLKNNEG